jgi:hypothetical protein
LSSVFLPSFFQDRHSSFVRPQPLHQPVFLSKEQTSIQGDFMRGFPKAQDENLAFMTGPRAIKQRALHGWHDRP